MALLAIGLTVLVGILIDAKAWTGFAGKTLWDWMELLIVPAALAAVALYFSRAEASRARALAAENAQGERERQLDRAREAALQDYLDRMSDLLLQQDLASGEAGETSRELARTRTLTVLRRLDGVRKSLVLAFLYDARLITLGPLEDGRQAPGAVSLQGADFSGAQLEGAKMPGSDLRGTDFQGAFLKDIDLAGSYLGEATFDRADLSGASLRGVKASKASFRDTRLAEATLRSGNFYAANFEAATLTAATLNYADLSGTRFSGATLEKARLYGVQLNFAKLSKADLRRAQLSSGAQLDNADFTEANLERASFRDSNLKSATFHGANLRGANFYASSVVKADFSRADLSDCHDLTQSKLDKAKLDEATKLPPELAWRPASEEGQSP